MKASEKTLKTAIVNYKCVGYFGKCLRPFSQKERSNIIDEMIKRNWLTERMEITPEGDKIIRANLDLAQY